NVPVRCGPVLVCTVKVTGPVPLPVAGLTLVIQGTLLDAVHEQPAAALTVLEPGAPGLAKLAVAGAMVAGQPPPCVTVNAWPATVSVPVRSGPSFACTAKATLPAPVPFGGLTFVIQDVLLEAVHAQPAAALTVTELCLPPLSRFAL